MTLIQIGGVVNPILSPIGVDAPWFHLVEGEPAVLLLIADSRLFALAGETDPREIDRLAQDNPKMFRRGATPLRMEQRPSALTLNIAQACNLGCVYCYADQGRFGGHAQLMDSEMAMRAIRRHIGDAKSGATVSVGFIGGEPLLNRAVLHASVAFASDEARLRGVSVTFGITTNGTLLEAEDLELIRSNPFAVTISIDGTRSVHDAQRRTRQGGLSFDRVMEHVSPLLLNPGTAKIAARVTLTRRSINESCVSAHVGALVEAGFREVGVSPLRTGPDEALRLRGADWSALLEQMRAAATSDWERVRMTSELLSFSNFSVALKQLHRGASEVLPCRAAAGYVSLGADGRYYSCHRAVGRSSCDVGTLETGATVEAREAFVGIHHVDRQEPCRTCWARYLCGGGCHVEVSEEGRSGCDYIRGWLEYCIAMYPKVLAERPDLLSGVSAARGNKR